MSTPGSAPIIPITLITPITPITPIVRFDDRRRGAPHAAFGPEVSR